MTRRIDKCLKILVIFYCVLENGKFQYISEWVRERRKRENGSSSVNCGSKHALKNQKNQFLVMWFLWWGHNDNWLLFRILILFKNCSTFTHIFVSSSSDSVNDILWKIILFFNRNCAEDR